MTIQVFISATTREFGDYSDDLSSLRGRLAHELTVQGLSPFYQGYLAKGGMPTLSELNLHIQKSDLVVHLVGALGGYKPTDRELQMLLTDLPKFSENLPELAKLSPKELAAVTYTDWEAWLAVYHKRPLLVLEPLFSIGSSQGPKANAVESEERSAHLKRLKNISEAYIANPVNDLDKAVNMINATARSHENIRPIGSNISPKIAIPSPPKPGPKRLPEMDLEHNYFGHDLLLDSIRSELLTPRDAKDKSERVVALWGEPGIGKSTLLAFLREDTDIKAAFPGGVLDMCLGKDVDESQISNCLRYWADKLGIPRDEVNDECKEEQDLREKIRYRIGEQRVLFLVDDIWVLALGKGVRIRASQSAYVFSTRTRTMANGLANPLVHQMMLISYEDSLALIRSIAGACFQVSPEITRKIEHVVSAYAGLPLVLEIIGESLRSMGDSTDEIEAYLANISGLQKADFPKVHQIFASSFDRLTLDLQTGLIRLAALKAHPAVFSIDLAKVVTKSSTVFTELVSRSELLRKVISPSRGYGCDESTSPSYYSIHQSIADWLLDKLDKNEEREVSAIAASYTEQQIRQGDAASRSDSDYEAWYRVEDPAWHQAMFDLRHYLIKAGEYKRLSFVLTNAWFCGFWWWDCYTPKSSYFCQELIKSWPVLDTSETQLLAAALADLKTLRDHYPKESEPERSKDPQRWLKVREALLRVCNRHVLDIMDTSRLTNEENDLFGLLCIFLAETYRFGDRDETLALKYYRDAVELFGKPYDGDPDLWNENWSQLHLAEGLDDFGRESEADTLCEKILREEHSKKRPDHEILSRANLIRAHYALELAQSVQAAEFLHNAVYCAYRFQVYKSFSPQSAMMEPDSYTLENYIDIAQQAATILLNPSHHSAGLEIALSLEARWRNGPMREEMVRTTFAQPSPEERGAALANAIFAAPLDRGMWSDCDARRGYQKKTLDHLSLLDANTAIQY